MDPHITMQNAQYQLDRVAAKWAELSKRELAAVRSDINTILRKHTEAPLGGLVGVNIVNVLETNLALDAHFSTASRE